MSYRARKALAIVVLVIALPLYIAAALWVVSIFERPPFLLELAVYVGLGVLWAVPLRRLFLGLGRPDPEESRRNGS